MGPFLVAPRVFGDEVCVRDLEALNDSDLLLDTPIGDLEVRMSHGFPGVWLKHRHDPERSRCIHDLAQGQVLDAIYGKRFWERAQVRAFFAAHNAEVKASDARHQADISADLKRGFRKLLNRQGDDLRQLFYRGGR